MFHETSYARSDVATWGVLRACVDARDCASVLHAASSRFFASGHHDSLPVYLHMFDASTIKRIDMLVGRYLDRSDNFAAPDIKPCME